MNIQCPIPRENVNAFETLGKKYSETEFKGLWPQISISAISSPGLTRRKLFFKCFLVKTTKKKDKKPKKNAIVPPKEALLAEREKTHPPKTEYPTKKKFTKTHTNSRKNVCAGIFF